ncbi:hypothetical protein AGMMS50268_18150 [Spirochaetia bacterium]|nr:hypothetical protein AGMMS50268_18150 [Spirochaetia bacterium]
MTTEFQIDGPKLDKIASAFKVKRESVQDLYEHYKKFSPCLREQCLAHIMRGMECYFRKELKNDSFRVICEPYKRISPGQKQASADYFQGSRFVINYNNNCNASWTEKQLRDYIAHEIGHLFLLATKDAKNKDKRRNVYTGITEPLSSIFGIFAMSEKNDFYANYDVSLRNHNDWQEILDSFISIHNGN